MRLHAQLDTITIYCPLPKAVLLLRCHGHGHDECPSMDSTVAHRFQEPVTLGVSDVDMLVRHFVTERDWSLAGATIALDVTRCPVVSTSGWRCSLTTNSLPLPCCPPTHCNSSRKRNRCGALCLHRCFVGVVARCTSRRQTHPRRAPTISSSSSTHHPNLLRRHVTSSRKNKHLVEDPRKCCIMPSINPVGVPRRKSGESAHRLHKGEGSFRPSSK